jgi:HSP20 family protein
MRFQLDPFRELWNELGRVSTDFQQTFTRQVNQSAGINVWSDDNNVYAEADLPGIDPAKIEVTINEGRSLTIAGERAIPANDKALWIRHERASGQFSRDIELPVVVNADAATSKYSNGVLTLTLPKSEIAKPRKIAVN